MHSALDEISSRRPTFQNRGAAGTLSILRIAKSLALPLLAVMILPAFAASAAENGRIEGTVKNNRGVAVPEVVVTATGPVNRSQLSDPDGRYEIAGLPAGVYTVTATRAGYVSNRQADVEVSAGAAVEVALILAAAPHETVVVTASRMEADLQSVPTSVTVVPSTQLETAPATNIGDLLRTVPGLNVVQTSARDINMASRQASPQLTNSQIALIDGRTIYSDFYDIIFWDLVPVSPTDIKQIEVVRGPASAVWGANATTGVINIITKSPRESPGTTVTLMGGGFSRDAGSTAGESVGGFGGASVTTSQVVNDRWAFRASAGYSFSDPYSRPVGQIPISTSPVDPSVVVGGGSYGDASFANAGTRQPKFDLRVDQEIGTAGRVTYEGGIAGSQGIIHTPIGPFKMEPGTYLGYGRVGYDNGRLRLSVFANILDGKAPNLNTQAADGSQLRIDFKTGTYDISGGYTQLVGNRHLLNYGGNFRYNSFDVSVTPQSEDRQELGGYIQDEIMLGKVRLPLGIRLDKFSSLSDVMVSPRAAVIYKPFEDHAFRVSYNRAHRAPSAIDNYLDISIISTYLPLGMINPIFGDTQFPLVTRSYGDPNLKAESLDAYEIGYSGRLPSRTSLEVAFYLNDTNHSIANLYAPEALIAAGVEPYYTSQNPPPGWPLPPEVIDLLAQQGIYLPANVKTLNYGKVRNKGFEFSVDQPLTASLDAFANYSRQALPQTRSPISDPFRYPAGYLGVPPLNRVNLGMNLNGTRFLGNFSLNYTDTAFWTDTRDPTFYGYTKAFTLVNCSFGVRWAEGKVLTSIRAINLLNDDIQQHIFGDILKRRVFGEVQIGF